MLRYLTAGESHGKFLTGILDGFPAGVKIDAACVARLLERRRLAPGRSARQKTESDAVEITGGVCKGLTTGAPIALLISNAAGRPGHADPWIVKPGHADLAGSLKYNVPPALIRERASARETAMRTALGAFPLRLLELLGIYIISRVTLLGRAADISRAGSSGPKAVAAMLAEINKARREGRTLGGIFEIYACGVPAGLGSHAQADRRLSARLAAAMFSINSVKGVEIGGGFCLAMEHTENTVDFPEMGLGGAVFRTNRAGGIEGGITNGSQLVINCALKPPPAFAGPVPSFNLKTGKKAAFRPVRHDTAAVPAAAVVAEAAAAFEIANALLEKFGGDSFGEIQPRVDAWRRRTKKILRGA
ncbi:MAG: chorismate synthase [Elusimicrobia bacterium]|nr:chorismate synthase [Elusimicrobiota bacterium]